MKRYFPLLVLMLTSSFLFAGAWNREKGHGYGQISFTYLRYANLLNGRNEPIGLKRPIHDFTSQMYLEYGISKRFNLILNMPFKFTGSENQISDVKNDIYPEDTLNAGTLNGASNITAGLRIALIQKSWVLTTQLLYSANVNDYDINTGLRTGYDAETFTPTLLFGKGWSQRYLQSEAGMQFRSNGYAQNFVGSVEGGMATESEKTWIMLRVDWKIPVTIGHYNEGYSVQTGLFRDNSAYISPGLKVNQKLTKSLWVNVAFYGAVYARYEGGAATLNLGLSYQW